MTKYIQIALTLCFALALTACGGSSEPAASAPAPTEPAESVPASEPADEVGDATEEPLVEVETAEEAGSDDKAEPEIDGNVNPEEASGDVSELAASLIGTKWTAGEFTIQFKDETTAHVNGGPLTMMTAGQGLDAEYTIDDDGKVAVTAMGQTREGKWDGENLMFDGAPAEPAE